MLLVPGYPKINMTVSELCEKLKFDQCKPACQRWKSIKRKVCIFVKNLVVKIILKLVHMSLT